MNVKWTVNEFSHALSVDIADLCDREADLLSRGRGDTFLDGARKRLVTLFQEFINTPTFNPEAERFRAKKTLLFDIKDMHQVSVCVFPPQSSQSFSSSPLPLPIRCADAYRRCSFRTVELQTFTRSARGLHVAAAFAI